MLDSPGRERASSESGAGVKGQATAFLYGILWNAFETCLLCAVDLLKNRVVDEEGRRAFCFFFLRLLRSQDANHRISLQDSRDHFRPGKPTVRVRRNRVARQVDNSTRV